MVAFLKDDGGMLGIAPEGTRSRTGQLIEGKPGISFIAVKAGVTFIPTAVYGTEKAISSLFRLRRATVTLVFGKPFELPPFERKNKEESLQKIMDEIMCQIAALLPDEYRGIYREHPRLLELINQKA
jgi:1-acyl-sn-glycerol-3-phosphate acyltransferase